MMAYLASPYSHELKSVMKMREEMISSIAAELTCRHQVTLFLPITQSSRMADLKPHLFGTSFAAWKDIDLDAINHCDELWVVKMDGWKQSIGVQAEIAHAKVKNMPIKYINPKTLKFVKR